jgi:hypothetical protein
MPKITCSGCGRESYQSCPECHPTPLNEPRLEATNVDVQVIDEVITFLSEHREQLFEKGILAKNPRYRDPEEQEAAWLRLQEKWRTFDVEATWKKLNRRSRIRVVLLAQSHYRKLLDKARGEAASRRNPVDDPAYNVKLAVDRDETLDGVYGCRCRICGEGWTERFTKCPTVHGTGFPSHGEAQDIIEERHRQASPECY